MEPTQHARAAITGSREVTFAVIAASFALVAIFAPVVFVSGILGQFPYVADPWAGYYQPPAG